MYNNYTNFNYTTSNEYGLFIEYNCTQCAGNRRTEMSRKERVRGLGWGPGAIGTGIKPAALIYLGLLCSESVISD